MASTAPPSERLHEAFLHQGQVRHALKTALACVLATALAYYFRVPNGQLAPVFVFVIMALGMPSPRLNWLLIQLAVGISATVSALILVAFDAAPFLYLALTLLWIFICVLFANWFPLPATMAAMVAAIGIFVNLHGTVGGTLNYYLNYGLNYLVAGFSVVVVHTLLWPLNTRQVFLRALGRSLRSSGRTLPPGGRPDSYRRGARGWTHLPLSGPRSARCGSSWLLNCGGPGTPPILSLG